MMAWRKIGFPGAYASYYDIVDQHGITIDRAPVSLAEDVHGHVHVDRRSRLACREQRRVTKWQNVSSSWM